METHKNYSAAEYEETLCVILREILCTDSVGVTDDLFELGLSSLGGLCLGKRSIILMKAPTIFQRALAG